MATGGTVPRLVKGLGYAARSDIARPGQSYISVNSDDGGWTDRGLRSLRQTRERGGDSVPVDDC